MKIENLRQIGKQLFSEIGNTRLKPFASEALGKGAGGDKTFPIDKKAEDIIISSLKTLNEPLSIVSEESGIEEIKGGGKKIIIDPIDGSKNAITGIPFYCTSIAVAEGDNIGSISMGYVINLLTGDEFWAEKGKGAFFNSERIYTQKDDAFYLISYEAQNPKNDIPKIMKLLGESWRTRCWGAVALDISYVAYGAVSVFITPSLCRSFDFASGYLLVKEAGGIFTDINGNLIDSAEIGLKRGASLLASGNMQLHEKALKLLHE
jgi:myo-inositol-1(or 4)-monophosphatase